MLFQVYQGKQDLGALDAALGVGFGDQVEFFRAREAVIDRLGGDVVVMILIEDGRTRFRFANNDLRCGIPPPAEQQPGDYQCQLCRLFRADDVGAKGPDHTKKVRLDHDIFRLGQDRQQQRHRQQDGENYGQRPE